LTSCTGFSDFGRFSSSAVSRKIRRQLTFKKI
jgi:hypothetical protein